MKTIFVTGGAGYIGSHTCLELLNEGYEVIVIDNLINSNIISLERVKEITSKDLKFYKGDILNENLLHKIFSENHVDAVIHFAGLKSVGESIKTPLNYYHVNVTGMISLLKTMDRYNVRKMVFSSSAVVYGNDNISPYTEDMPLSAANPYGSTKIMAEEMLDNLYSSDKRWSIAKLRYFNPIGAHESGKIGEDPDGIPSNLMPYITQVAVGRREYLCIYGDDYSTHDGTGVRDYIHVMDLALGHIKALESLEKSTGVNAYNLGTGEGYSVLDMVKTFERINSVSIKYKIMPRRQGDSAVSFASTSKAKFHLDWSAERGIDEMCRDAWNWQKNNPNGYGD